MRPRVIPALLLQNQGLVKTVNFKNPTYVGDIINSIKIYNESEVDELSVLDIDASKEGRGPDFEFIKDFASESFVPLSYGGGVTELEQIRKLFYIGIEKVLLNSIHHCNKEFIKNAAKEFGSQSIVAVVNVKKNLFGKYSLYNYLKGSEYPESVVEYTQSLAESGAGEIFLNDVSNDGKMSGFDRSLIEQLSRSVDVPLIACGGAGEYADLRTPIEAGAHAVAAGSLFIYQNKKKGVLVNYPTQNDLDKIFAGYGD